MFKEIHIEGDLLSQGYIIKEHEIGRLIEGGIEKDELADIKLPPINYTPYKNYEGLIQYGGYGATADVLKEAFKQGFRAGAWANRCKPDIKHITLIIKPIEGHNLKTVGWKAYVKESKDV